MATKGTFAIAAMMSAMLSASMLVIGCAATTPAPAPSYEAPALAPHVVGGGAPAQAPAAAAAAAPATGTIPGYLPENPNLTQDITCRPTLQTQDKSGSISAVGDLLPACKPLYPLTRLLLENASISANDTYTNQAGIGNTLIAHPNTTAEIQSSNVWQFGIGYTSKPILKQVRGLFLSNDEREATAQQGTFWDDVFWEAIAMNASLSYGQALAKTNGMLTDALTTRPFYSVSASYSLNLERMWIYLSNGFNSNVHPMDPGYYIESQFQETAGKAR